MLWVNLGLVSPTLTLVIELAAFWRPLVERGSLTDLELVIQEILQDKITIDYEASGLATPEGV